MLIGLTLCAFVLVGNLYGMITGKNIISGKPYWSNPFKTSPKRKTSKNPYIQYHKLKNKNDDDYQDYLEWLKKNGNGVPLEKVVAPEDKKAEKEINNLLK